MGFILARLLFSFYLGGLVVWFVVAVVGMMNGRRLRGTWVAMACVWPLTILSKHRGAFINMGKK